MGMEALQQVAVSARETILMLYILQDYFIQKEEEGGRVSAKGKHKGRWAEKGYATLLSSYPFQHFPSECCYFGILRDFFFFSPHKMCIF